jgi:hypothetical protein
MEKPRLWYGTTISSIQIMRFCEMDVLASSHVMGSTMLRGLSCLIHVASWMLSKTNSQSRHILARQTNSETVHRRSYQGRRSENIGDVRPIELNLKPSFTIASLSRSMILRNGMDLKTLHRDIVANVMRSVYGDLLKVRPSQGGVSAFS